MEQEKTLKEILAKILTTISKVEEIPSWLVSVVSIEPNEMSIEDVSPGMFSEASALLQLSVARTEIEKEEANKRRIEAEKEIVALEDFQNYLKELGTKLNIYFVEAEEESK